MIIAILSLCILVVIVLYVRYKQPKETAQSSVHRISTPIKESREVQRGVEGDSAKTKAERGDFPEPADEPSLQASSEVLEIASGESGTHQVIEKIPVIEREQNAPIRVQVPTSAIRKGRSITTMFGAMTF